MKYLNKEFINTRGVKTKTIKHLGNSKYLCEFDDGYKKKISSKELLNGRFTYPYERTVCNVGYLGVGKYSMSIYGKHTPEYRIWKGMLGRCYSENARSKFPTYSDVTVCDEWHNFQNFARWYHESYYTFNGERMNLDKDILFKGNKVYSPETCVFVPQSVNKVFTKNNARRGSCPIGVTYHKRDCVYEASCMIFGTKRHVYLGRFSNPDDAFRAYKHFKESTIAEFANRNKDKLPIELYEALLDYRVERGD